MKMYTLPKNNRLQLKMYSLLVSLFISLSLFSQNVSISAKDTLPNAAAGLDVYFSNKGLLIPRVALTGTANFAPLSAHVAGMIVYNTATVLDVKPGFYYDDGTKWITGFPVGSNIGDMLFWNGTAWAMIPVGTSGQYLQLSATNVPSWAGVTIINASLTTTAITTFTATTATAGGNISADNGLTVLSRGVCYAITQNPTIANSISVANPAGGIGSYTCNLTGLTRATTYYVRAYATNSAVTTYAPQQSFTTLALAPTLATTTAATGITASTAISGGNVTDDGGSPITERGICFGTTSAPTILANTKVVDPLITTGSFVSNLTGLLSGTTYYVRSYAINSLGTSYGAAISFMTLPSVTTTTAATSITATSASTGGVLAPFQTLYNVYYYGVAYSTTSNAATPTKVQTGTYPAITGLTFVQSLTGLTSNTLYYIRAYATTSGGITVYGPELSFTTSAPTLASVTTTAVTSITPTSALSGYTIVTDGGSPVTAKGVCWGTSSGTVLGTNNFTNDAFTVSSMTNLTSSTTYFVRAYATNSVGTAYGNEFSFSTCGIPVYTIGQLAGGGKVFYVDCTGQHGLIASTVDLGTAVWGCSTVLIGTSAAYGTGAANTAAILAGCATRPNCASLASSYTGGGFTDWYLPSQAELLLLMGQASLFSFGQAVTYASSSENGINNVSADYWNGSTVISSAAVKTYAIQVRAVRSF
jgi:hypothetical protein